MPQDNLVKLACSECKRVNYQTTRNKKKIKKKLELNKFCKWCRKHTLHKELR
ncbi:MAG: 50S ribosomal protein L33 [Patescibacteria group bacterium]|nr:50S ribosomal protein L33 [Patescibacteria group bacterium]